MRAAIVWKEIMDRASSANKLARRSPTNLHVVILSTVAIRAKGQQVANRMNGRSISIVRIPFLDSMGCKVKTERAALSIALFANRFNC